MKRIKPMVLTVATTMFVLASCDIKDPIYEPYDTDHPDHGKITLTTDWSNIGEGITKPASYTVKVGDYSATLSGDVNTIDNLFVPNTYRAYIYNTADNIALSGTIATASYTAGMLGWFFSSAMDVKVVADADHAFTAVIQQQVRELTLVIKPVGGTVDKIESITATLSGVAGTLDIDNDTHGGATGVTLAFSKITSGADEGKWSATVRLLGVTGAEQKMSGTIKFTGGTPGDLPLTSDLTSQLATFNADKKAPLTLDGEAVETQTETGFTATINSWTATTNRPGTAN